MFSSTLSISSACETASIIPEGTQSPLVRRPKVCQLMDILGLFCSGLVNIKDTERSLPGRRGHWKWPEVSAEQGPALRRCPVPGPAVPRTPTVCPKENRCSTSQGCLGGLYLSQVRRRAELPPAGCRGGAGRGLLHWVSASSNSGPSSLIPFVPLMRNNSCLFTCCLLVQAWAVRDNPS